jgi:hypothetical protein
VAVPAALPSAVFDQWSDSSDALATDVIAVFLVFAQRRFAWGKKNNLLLSYHHPN